MKVYGQQYDQYDLSLFLWIVGVLIFSAWWFTEYGMWWIPLELAMVLILWLTAMTYVPFIRQTKRYGLTIVFVLWLFALAVELFAIQTCWLYGCFTYSDLLGYKIMWAVPRILFFTWPPLVLGAVWLFNHFKTSPRILAFWSGLLLVVIDLILDPVAVAQGFWSFSESGRWYNIPWTNFLGWLLSGTVGSYLLLNLLQDANYPDAPKSQYMRWSLFCSLVFFSSAAFFLGLLWPGVIGVVLIILYLVLAARHGHILHP